MEGPFFPQMNPEKRLLKTPKFTVVERQLPDRSVPVICHPGAVVILPWIDATHICLITNQRSAVNQQLIELPAGTREPAETPAETATRELAEETGFRAGRIEPLFSYYVSPGILDEKMHAFVARDLSPGETQLMEDEEIDTMIVEFEEAIDWVKTGKICDAKTISTLLYYQQFAKGDG